MDLTHQNIGDTMFLKKINGVLWLGSMCLSLFVSPTFADSMSLNSPSMSQALQGALKEASEAQRVPGALVLIRTPKEQVVIPFGTTELDKKNSPRATDFFRIGSNTKSMISAVIVQLAQEKKLNLEDPVSKYIPKVPNGDKITLSMLLKNRSGLYNYLQSPKLAIEFDKNPLKDWKPEELLQLSFEHPPAKPDVEFDYCNTNFILLGMIAEKLEKKSMPVIFKERLFTPLGMHHTYLPTSAETNMQEPFAHGYAYGGSAHVFTHVPYSPEFKRNVLKNQVKPVDYTNQSPSWSWASGGVVSNAEDMAIWIEALSEGKLFKQPYLEKWKKSPEPIDPKNPAVTYGFGFMTFVKDTQFIYFHSGELPGFNSYMLYDANKKQSLIIWSNLTISLDVHPTAEKIRDKIFAVLRGKK
jgi:D-alanyl-D-alanine carboxypeptidase